MGQQLLLGVILDSEQSVGGWALVQLESKGPESVSDPLAHSFICIFSLLHAMLSSAASPRPIPSTCCFLSASLIDGGHIAYLVAANLTDSIPSSFLSLGWLC